MIFFIYLGFSDVTVFLPENIWISLLQENIVGRIILLHYLKKFAWIVDWYISAAFFFCQKNLASKSNLRSCLFPEVWPLQWGWNDFEAAAKLLY